jgi:hypothetical protein
MEGTNQKWWLDSETTFASRHKPVYHSWLGLDSPSGEEEASKCKANPGKIQETSHQRRGRGEGWGPQEVTSVLVPETLTTSSPSSGFQPKCISSVSSGKPEAKNSDSGDHGLGVPCDFFFMILLRLELRALQYHLSHPSALFAFYIIFQSLTLLPEASL